jgi:hypothetical protein
MLGLAVLLAIPPGSGVGVVASKRERDPENIMQSTFLRLTAFVILLVGMLWLVPRATAGGRWLAAVRRAAAPMRR